MHYRDLRGWLEGVESFGELRVVEGADWNQEIGAVAEVGGAFGDAAGGSV